MSIIDCEAIHVHGDDHDGEFNDYNDNSKDLFVHPLILLNKDHHNMQKLCK